MVKSTHKNKSQRQTKSALLHTGKSFQSVIQTTSRGKHISDSQAIKDAPEVTEYGSGGRWRRKDLTAKKKSSRERRFNRI